ncbi:MAG: alpha/beta hydrolase family protein [Acidimicrobiales bacterium]
MADHLVQSAIDHWGPRFIQNGIDASDFTQITRTIDKWDDWCRTWSEAGTRHEELGHTALESGHANTAGTHFAQASSYFHFAKFVFVADLEQMKAAHMAAVANMNRALELLSPHGERLEVPYRNGVLIGNLRTPLGEGPFPLVVMLSGLDSTKEELRSTEEIFLDRGIATFAVDGPGQGEAEYTFAIEGEWEHPGAAILDFISSHPSIDADRIGIWGVSLGGYYAPRVAAFDPRIKATIALSGPYNFAEDWEQLPDLTREAFRVRSHSETFAEAREKAGALSLRGCAGSIERPLLIVFGERDRLIPSSHAYRLAEEAPHATLLMFPDGNHVCTNIGYKHRYYSADWMASQLHTPV